MGKTISDHAHVRLLERSEYHKKEVVNALKCIMKNGVTINDIPPENWRHKRYMYAYSQKGLGKVLKFYYKDFIYIINVKQKRLITFIPVRVKYKPFLEEIYNKKMKLKKENRKKVKKM